MDLCLHFKQDPNTKYLSIEIAGQLVKLSAAPELASAALFKFGVQLQSIAADADEFGAALDAGTLISSRSVKKGTHAHKRRRVLMQNSSAVQLDPIRNPLMSAAIATMIASKIVSASQAIMIPPLQHFLEKSLGVVVTTYVRRPETTACI